MIYNKNKSDVKIKSYEGLPKYIAVHINKMLPIDTVVEQ